MELKWATLLLLAALLSSSSSLDWQGAGEWTQDNLTIIRQKIFSIGSSDGVITFVSRVETFSNQLNTLWSPAWNVFIVYYYDGKNYDAVLYGYAFRSHWFWFNGYKYRQDQGYVSFIIWKDYNCITWTTFSPFGSPLSSMASSLSSAITSKVRQARANPVRSVDDIWLLAQDVQAALPASDASLFQEKTVYSIVAAPTTSVYVFGRFCAKDYVMVQQVGYKPGGAFDGVVFIMQMRDQ